MLKALLFPFAVLYDLITRVRNYLYDTQRRGSIQFEANVIAVGNLTVGGTGKTPHVEYLIRLLSGRYKVATLSRGYGRKTRGFLLAGPDASAQTMGDEPFLYYHKYGQHITVAVGEERALAIPTILFEKPDTQVILLDDAYQHRTVRPLVNILLCDYNRPFYTDFLLPYGRLREARKGAQRADIVVVSKSPELLAPQDRIQIIEQVQKYTTGTTPVLFTSVKYTAPKHLYTQQPLPTSLRKAILVTGLANATPLKNYVDRHYTLLKHLEYRDHYIYKSTDIQSIVAEYQKHAQEDSFILTTEKDMVKMLAPSEREVLETLPIYYIPIEVYFTDQKDATLFESIILEKGIHF
jgi:tetraacyldisaccharide 4'-kinase